MVLLHGGPGLDHHLLLPLALPLAERHEVWLADLPGHGPEAEGREAPSLRALEIRLGRWLRGLTCESASPSGAAVPTVLIGHSLGAWLARELLRPDGDGPPAGSGVPGLAGVVLLSPPAAGQGDAATALRRAGRLMGRGKEGRRGQRKKARRGERVRREVLAHVDAETAGEPSPLFRAALDRAELRDSRRYAALVGELHRRLMAPPEPFDPGTPVLVLCGEEDRTTPPEQARRVAEGMRGARLELLPGAGHYPFADAAEATASAIERFVSACGS